MGNSCYVASHLVEKDKEIHIKHFQLDQHIFEELNNIEVKFISVKKANINAHN